MFNNKKGNILRHPYATLMVVGLATAGAITIGGKVKQLFTYKGGSLSNMLGRMKNDTEMMHNLNQ